MKADLRFVIRRLIVSFSFLKCKLAGLGGYFKAIYEVIQYCFDLEGSRLADIEKCERREKPAHPSPRREGRGCLQSSGRMLSSQNSLCSG